MLKTVVLHNIFMESSKNICNKQPLIIEYNCTVLWDISVNRVASFEVCISVSFGWKLGPYLVLINFLSPRIIGLWNIIGLLRDENKLNNMIDF